MVEIQFTCRILTNNWNIRTKNDALFCQTIHTAYSKFHRFFLPQLIVYTKAITQRDYLI